MEISAGTLKTIEEQCKEEVDKIANIIQRLTIQRTEIRNKEKVTKTIELESKLKNVNTEESLNKLYKEKILIQPPGSNLLNRTNKLVII